MKLLLPALATGVALVAVPAFAQNAAPPPGSPQNPVVSSPDYPHTGGGSPGVPGPEAVNPAPGAPGPYVGAGKHGFYDVDQRIADVSGRIAGLPAGQRRKAAAALRSIKSDEAVHLAKDGGLRDWERENLNHKLDMLVQQYPGLGGSQAG